MKKITFYKYQGTGNDFVIIDNRDNSFPIIDNTSIVNRLCDRKFGVGADGLILLMNDVNSDFIMKYYNADGNESSMCGNGGRCIVAFAKYLGIIEKETSFFAIDGKHDAIIKDNWVELKMADVDKIEAYHEDWILDTGSPHYIQFIENSNKIDVYEKGKSIRYNDRFSAKGINVNFVEIMDDKLSVLTYERGVEDETLSCGTGVTAAALIYGHLNPQKDNIDIHTKGGELKIKFNNHKNGSFNNIWLCGPTELVFSGEIKI